MNSILLLESQVEAVTVKHATSPIGYPTIADEPAGGLSQSRVARVLVRVALLVAAVPLSMLPERWRRRIHIDALPWAAGSVVSAIAQGLGTLVLGGLLYWLYVDSQTMQAGMESIVMAGPIRNVPLNEGHLMGLGATTFVGFIFSLGGVLVLYLWTESLIRLLTSIVGGEAVGLSILWLAERAFAGVGYLWMTARQGRSVADKVTVPAPGQLTIKSCSPREWDSSVVLEFKGEYFTLMSHRRSEDPIRPFVYGFQTAPTWAVLRQVVQYDPRDVVRGSLGPTPSPMDDTPAFE